MLMGKKNGEFRIFAGTERLFPVSALAYEFLALLSALYNQPA
jgi:hypothetical protein